MATSPSNADVPPTFIITLATGFGQNVRTPAPNDMSGKVKFSLYYVRNHSNDNETSFYFQSTLQSADIVNPGSDTIMSNNEMAHDGTEWRSAIHGNVYTVQA